MIQSAASLFADGERIAARAVKCRHADGDGQQLMVVGGGVGVWRWQLPAMPLAYGNDGR
ncbi:hypothetical protein BPORC_1839 [Bifidobacterium porcinum]|nr:hypothetical protein BPORC_1839 [Bifidobacterium porcinum]